jgi:hypothetical protein
MPASKVEEMLFAPQSNNEPLLNCERVSLPA